MQEKNEFTEKDYLEAQYKIQRSIQANVNVITFIVATQFLLNIIGAAITYFYLSSLPSLITQNLK
ncbi:MAG: hypothetical protein HXL38_000750 [Candidatus Saccharimonas sp.]|nr:MAG: hypothetical protein HXL38_000750 [Candidatus Saccharimonas sp.]